MLLERLENRIGERGKALECFASYLSDRSFVVVVNSDGISSNVTPILRGVPQGSIEGPLLF